MVRITIDEELKQKLQNTQGSVMLCDSAGKLMGSFTSLPEGVESLWDLMPEMTEEEFDRRLNSNEPGLTTAELKAKLRRLP